MVPSRRRKLGYAVLTIGVPYLLSKTEGYLTSSLNEMGESSWRERVQRWITTGENIHSTLSLLNFLAFLVNGRYYPLPPSSIPSLWFLSVLHTHSLPVLLPCLVVGVFRPRWGSSLCGLDTAPLQIVYYDFDWYP